jgi:hypothetical protein
LRDKGRLSVFLRNILKCWYLLIIRGSANRTGWDSAIGSFVIGKSTNSVRIMGKNYEI